MNIFDVIFLSIIEGLTEFLPISSTGHMVIVSYFMGIAENEFVKNFEIIIQFGAILAVVVIYKKRFMQSINFYKNLMIAFVPTGILGFLLKHRIEQWLESVSLVAWTLILGGIVLIWSDKHFEKLKSSKKSDSDLNKKELIYLGLWQSLALIPGVSRSGATIMGACSMA